jgi:hypothetical protein
LISIENLLLCFPYPHRNGASFTGENKNKEEMLPITIDNEPALDGKVSTQTLSLPIPTY